MTVTDSLRKQLDDCALVDRHRLLRQWRKIERMDPALPHRQELLGRLEAGIAKSVQQCDIRENAIPSNVTVPDNLPIASKANRIRQLLLQHQVLVVAGETGSGKTTQLPKICLQAGFGRKGLIGHTQPRRLAAISVANRIAEELGVRPGQGVGYQIRFNDATSEATYLKLMTDGILLAEIQQDRFLDKYQVLIIDEAHERSLNIDFILGYLKQLLPRRPQLKVIITSATIDVDKISRHFDDAPVVTVSGRMFPVEIRYAPPVEQSDSLNEQDLQLEAIVKSVNDLQLEDDKRSGGGDVLVFLSSEKEIRETALAIRKRNIRNTEVLPLYSRLRQSEQNRIFQSHPGRRVVLATNIAETSLTVPGIRYVIDAGMARISRYSVQSKIQRLPVEPISKASANQRAGRCGRVADGICIRLYDENDFNSRPEFTEPEIQRTNLAAVILQMISLGLGDVSRFPFLEKPPAKAINDGFKLLFQLGAINDRHTLTSVGQTMSRLPVDPRFGRMLIAADRLGCLREMQIIVSALGIADPKDVPADKRQAAQEKHKEFAHEESDFLSLVKLWFHFEGQRQLLTQNQLRKYCSRYYLSYVRMREWRETHRQLVVLCQHLKLKVNKSEAGYREVHTAFLTGSLNQLGCHQENKEYLGSRNRKFHLLPSSTVYKRTPKWIVSNQIIETDRAFSPSAAKVEPQWIEEAAGHLIKKSWSDPHWSKKNQRVMAWEKVSLFGLVLVERRQVAFGNIDPDSSRRIFIQEALVGRQLEVDLEFYTHNLAQISRLEKEEKKLRKQSYFLDDTRLEEFYESRIPPNVQDRESLNRWYREQIDKEPRLLHLTLEDLLNPDAGKFRAGDFPDQAEIQGNKLAVAYQFEPGKRSDGATIEIPLPLLGQIRQADLDWSIPGQLRERCIHLIKSLPKAIRKQLIPVAGFVDEALEVLEETQSGITLTQALAEQAGRLRGIRLEPAMLDDSAIPGFLKVKLKLVDSQGKVLATDTDLEKLRSRYLDRDVSSGPSSETEREIAHPFECGGLQDWDLETFPDQITIGGKLSLIRYPALVDDGDSVSVKLMQEKSAAHSATGKGLVRLYMLRTSQQEKVLRKQFRSMQKEMGLKLPPFLSGDEICEQFLYTVYSDCFEVMTQVPRDRETFNGTLQSGKSGLIRRGQSIIDEFHKLVPHWFSLRSKVVALKHPHQQYLRDDVKSQLDGLLAERFLIVAGSTWIGEYSRYLEAVAYRLEKAELQPQRDRLLHDEVNNHWQRLIKAAGQRSLTINDAISSDAGLQQIRWSIEELRVSLFAQHLKTRVSISSTRLDKLWQQLSG